MTMKKMRRIITSVLVVSLLAVSAAFMASAESHTTRYTSAVSSSTVSWSFTSTGSGNYIKTYYWDYVTPGVGVSIPSKVAKRSEMSPNTWVLGPMTADYWGNRVFTSKTMINHMILNDDISANITG